VLINARNRSVAIEGDQIVSESGRFDVTLDCIDAEIRPGLINAHDHLHRNHYGRLGKGPYPNAYCWAADIQTRFRRRIERRRQVPRRASLLAGAWKNLFAGVTTVVHHDAWEPDFDRSFPIQVARVDSADSIGLTRNIEPSGTAPFCLHVAEGIDHIAASELAEIDRRALLNESLIAVHCVGVGGSDAAHFVKSGAAMAWCPTSNHFLFGRSAPKELLESGCDMLLGSDSLLTGAGDLLDEMHAARALRAIDDEQLDNSVGRTSARRLGLPEPSLEPGSRADLTLIRKPLAEARAEDVALTMVGGVPRVAHSDVARNLGTIVEHGTKMRVGRVVRWTNQRGIVDETCS
jgi:cytosine/adenosine deaminase-related metal-dependent hydrolase